MTISSLLIINDFCATRGGADEVAIVEAASVAARGIPVHFAHMDAGIGNRHDPRLTAPRISLHDFSALGGLHRPRKFLVDGIRNKKVMTALCALAKELGDNCVIHVHGWTKGFSPLIFTLGKRLRRKVVYTLHDFVPACPNGAFYDFSSNAICPRRPMGLSCAVCNCDRQSRSKKAWRLIRQLAIRHYLNRGRSFQERVTVSRFARGIFERNGVAIDHVISNPIDVARVEFRDSSAQKDLYFLGRLVPEKGPDVLAAAARVAKVSCHFIGTGPLEATLKVQYPEHHFLGWQNRAMIGRYLDQARAVIFPSRWYETQGLAPLEAAAYGVPTLCADTCAASENAIDGETGITFPQVGVANLTQALLRVQDDALISKLSRNAYNRFWSGGHAPESHADKLLTLYSSLQAGNEHNVIVGSPPGDTSQS